MPILRIPTPLRPYTAGQNEVSLQGNTVGEVIEDLIRRYPTIKPHLVNEEGALRAYVNLFLGENNIKDLQGLDTPLQETDRLRLIPSIAGGNTDVPRQATRRRASDTL